MIDNQVDDSLLHATRKAGSRVVAGDIRDEETLIRAGIDHARCFIIATGDDCANIESAIAARERNKEVMVVVRMYDQTIARRIETAFNVQALSSTFIASPAYVSAATDDSILAMVEADGCYLTFHDTCHVPDDSPVGAFVEQEGAALRLIDPDSDRRPSENCLCAAVHDPSNLSRPGRSRRPTGLIASLKEARTVLHPVKIGGDLADVWRNAPSLIRSILSATLLIGLISMLVFSFFDPELNPVSAVCMVLVSLATGGYEGVNLWQRSPWLQAYGAIMILCGAVLVQGIYALVADRILTARVEHLLGHRDAGLRDHVVVIGLGNLGHRVANELKVLGMDVVAVEASEDSDNVAAARGVFPVVVGDARKRSILDKAGIEQAKVLLALTDDQMLNLSVALHARQRNPGLKTVIRTYDLDLADKFRDSGADIVLSTSAIAAPAFVDAALHPGVQGSFRRNDKDILVLRLTADPDSEILDRSVGEIAEKLGIAVILAAESADSDYRPASADTIVRPGWRVIALVTREKLGQVMART